ncbi:hypothetical protein BMS3Abin13_00554 [bacterium BMS3Abin13]|nr:hypothetical protein BMS3Abin13_00554 [bacterium BMS3Abin13]
MMEFIGVRSSCDMLARKDDLSRSSSRSSRLACSSRRVRSLSIMVRRATSCSSSRLKEDILL